MALRTPTASPRAVPLGSIWVPSPHLAPDEVEVLTRDGLPIRNPRRYGPAFTDSMQPPRLTLATPHGPGVPVPAWVKPPAVETILVKHLPYVLWHLENTVTVARRKLPSNRIDYLAVVPSPAAPLRRPVRKQRLDPRPLRVGQRHIRTNDQMIRTKRPRCVRSRLARSRRTMLAAEVRNSAAKASASRSWRMSPVASPCRTGWPSSWVAVNRWRRRARRDRAALCGPPCRARSFPDVSQGPGATLPAHLAGLAGAPTIGLYLPLDSVRGPVHFP
ncbi:hypothetical protein QFZ67_000176 [Streptomyces sp. V1I1]|nr:hypothetical protein [Streptomyces sp. V1I1]